MKGRPSVIKLQQPHEDRPPACPRGVSAAVRKKWNEVCAVLADEGILSDADADLLLMYCQAWVRWTEAESKIATDGMVKTGAKGDAYSVWLAIANKALEQVRRLGKQLGLEPGSRRKLQRKRASAGVPTRDRRQGPPPPSPTAKGASAS